jgi:hypothetical protein
MLVYKPLELSMFSEQNENGNGETQLLSIVKVTQITNTNGVQQYLRWNRRGLGQSPMDIDQKD